MRERKNKKGQMTLLIILAIVLVGAIVIFFLLEQKSPKVGGGTFDSEQFIEVCVQDAIIEAADKMMIQGGFLEPKNFKVYNDTQIEYLCITNNYYVPCINQHPMLMNEMRGEIKEYISPRVKNCFEGMKKEVERKGGSVEMSPESADIEVSLAPGIAIANIAREVIVTSRDGTMQRFEKFDVEASSPIYDLAGVAIDIANEEAKYCYFEYAGYIFVEQSVDIRKFVMSDSTKIYMIEDRESGKRFNIAIKGCVLPAGL